MVVLDNVRKTDIEISADYYYQDESDKGHFVYDIKSGEIRDVSYNAEDTPRDVHYSFGHVRDACRLMLKANKYPKTLPYLWY